jgi:hypothetical protein
MALLIRVVRFINHESHWWPLALIAAIGLACWRQPNLRSDAILLSMAIALFVGPYPFRHALIRRYERIRPALVFGMTAAVLGAIASRAFGQGPAGAFVLGLSSALILGVLFWCVSDPMYEMIDWLAFPTEWGRAPDEIYQVDQRRIPWPGESEPVQCWLFRFRYNEQWDYGIAGPITFALFEQNFEGKQPEEIFAAFAQWYGNEGIGDMIDRQREQDSNAD